MRLGGRSAPVNRGGPGIGAPTPPRLAAGGAAGGGPAPVGGRAAEGARVAVADLDPDRARDVSGEVDGHHVEMDVTDNASIVARVAPAAEAIGPPDGLCNT